VLFLNVERSIKQMEYVVVTLMVISLKFRHLFSWILQYSINYG